MSTDIVINPLTSAIGAEVSGIDLNQPLSTAATDSLYQALMDHMVIFFRKQNITPARHIAFAKSLGLLDAPHPIYEHVDGS